MNESDVDQKESPIVNQLLEYRKSKMQREQEALLVDQPEDKATDAEEEPRLMTRNFKDYAPPALESPLINSSQHARLSLQSTPGTPYTSVGVPSRVMYDMTRKSQNQQIIKSGQARSLNDLHGTFQEEILPKEDLKTVRKEYFKK